ncbi:MAG: nuclear transport factor 2 family protein [Balneolaceae bacterium]
MRSLFLFFILVSFSFYAVGCSEDRRETDTADTETAEREITEIIEGGWAALGEQDLEHFNQYSLPNWLLYTAIGNKMDAETLFSNHRQNMTEFNIDYSNLDINIHNSVAWATYDANMTGLWDGEEWGGDFIFTTVFVREDGEWKISHMHESRVQ